MYMPRIGPASRYDPAARQMQQQPQGLLGVAPTFQPAQIDQGLLAQGLQAQMNQAQQSGGGLDMAKIAAAVKEQIQKQNPELSPTNPQNAANAPAAPTQQPNPFTSAFNNAMDRFLPQGALDNFRSGLNGYLPHSQVGAVQNWFNSNLNPNGIFRR
jgi:hypothetical protein